MLPKLWLDWDWSNLHLGLTVKCHHHVVDDDKHKDLNPNDDQVINLNLLSAFKC